MIRPRSLPSAAIDFSSRANASWGMPHSMPRTATARHAPLR